MDDQIFSFDTNVIIRSTDEINPDRDIFVELRQSEAKAKISFLCYSVIEEMNNVLNAFESVRAKFLKFSKLSTASNFTQLATDFLKSISLDSISTKNIKYLLSFIGPKTEISEVPEKVDVLIGNIKRYGQMWQNILKTIKESGISKQTRDKLIQSLQAKFGLSVRDAEHLSVFASFQLPSNERYFVSNDKLKERGNANIQDIECKIKELSNNDLFVVEADNGLKKIKAVC